MVKHIVVILFFLTTSFHKNFFYYCKFLSTMLYLDLIIKTSPFSRNAFDDRAYCQVCWMNLITVQCLYAIKQPFQHKTLTLLMDALRIFP